MLREDGSRIDQLKFDHLRTKDLWPLSSGSTRKWEHQKEQREKNKVLEDEYNFEHTHPIHFSWTRFFS